MAGRVRRSDRAAPKRHARAQGAYRRAAVKRAEPLIEIRLPAAARSSPRRSSRTSARPTPARRTTRSGSSPSAGAASTRARCACWRRRRTGVSSDELGPERVGLVTGEERVNERGPDHLLHGRDGAVRRATCSCSTRCSGPTTRSAAAAWTRLLLSGEYRHIRLLGALDALPLVRSAFPDAEVRIFERMLPLEWIGDVQLRSVLAGHRRWSRSAARPCSRSRAR